jgi:hypothetical protein
MRLRNLVVHTVVLACVFFPLRTRAIASVDHGSSQLRASAGITLNLVICRQSAVRNSDHARMQSCSLVLRLGQNTFQFWAKLFEHGPGYRSRLFPAILKHSGLSPAG